MKNVKKVVIVSNNASHDDVTVTNFSNATAPFLKLFTKVRIIEYLSALNETDTLKKKNKVCDVRMTEEPFLT